MCGTSHTAHFNEYSRAVTGGQWPAIIILKLTSIIVKTDTCCHVTATHIQIFGAIHNHHGFLCHCLIESIHDIHIISYDSLMAHRDLLDIVFLD